MTQRSAYIVVETDLNEEELGDLIKKHLNPIALYLKDLTPRCCVCKTTEGLMRDGEYGYRCASPDCMCF